MSVREEEGEGEGEGEQEREGDQWEEGGGVGGEATGRLTRRSRFRKWHPTNANEMKEFFTIILNMGLINLPQIEDWKDHG